MTPARMPQVVLATLTATLTVALATSCGNEVDPSGTRVAQQAPTRAAPAGECPPPDAAGNAAIDWAPFVAVSGAHFQAVYPVVDVAESALGDVVSTVQCTISDVVGNSSYEVRDGDAAYLPAGTELREIVGYRTDFRLAACEDGGWRLYETYQRDGATTGADLLDLEGKVTAIHLVEGDTGTGILRSVDDPAVVTAIVSAVLAAPIIPAGELGEDRYDETPLFVRFDLVDGSSVQRSWAVEAGIIGIDLAAPAALTEALSPRAP